MAYRQPPGSGRGEVPSVSIPAFLSSVSTRMRRPLLRTPRIACPPSRPRVRQSRPGTRWAGTIGSAIARVRASGSRAARPWAGGDPAVATFHAREVSGSARDRLRPGSPGTPPRGGRRRLRANALLRAGKASRWIKPGRRGNRRPPPASGSPLRLPSSREPSCGRLAGHKAYRHRRAPGWCRR